MKKAILLYFLMLLFSVILCQRTTSEASEARFGYNIQRNLQSPNYITIKYDQQAYFLSSITTNQFNNKISKIIQGANNYRIEDQFTINANMPFEIHFSNPIESMENFFFIFNRGQSNNRIYWVDLSKFDTTSLENIKGMFNGCSNLKEVDFSNFKTSKVKNMANMFHNCKELKTLD